MRKEVTTQSAFKTKLFSQIEALGRERSLLPFSDATIDENIRQLENVNPISQPLHPDNFISLLGDWQLVYASNGTVVTRSIAEFTNTFDAAIAVKRVWQTLASKDGKIIADNQALIKLPLLGAYQLGAKGVWRSEPDNQAAKVTFNTFCFQATQCLGQSNWSLPTLTIPVLEFLRNEALWITTYLDEDTRVGRGRTGNLFVFNRYLS